MNNQTVKLNQKGVTLIELMISIVVGSIVISMLMSILVMSLKAKASFDVDNKLYNESFYIAEKIQFNIFELGPQEIEINTVGDVTTITIRHLYDISTDDNNVLVREMLVTPIEDVIVLTNDPVDGEGTITYNGELLHSDNVFMTTGSEIELISVDTCDFDIEACEQGVIKLTLYITIEISPGVYVDSQLFITKIII